MLTREPRSVPRRSGRRVVSTKGLTPRNLILLYAWAELSYEQLAEALGLPIGTVRSRLSRTRAKLRARVLPTETVVLGGGKAS